MNGQQGNIPLKQVADYAAACVCASSAEHDRRSRKLKAVEENLIARSVKSSSV